MRTKMENNESIRVLHVIGIMNRGGAEAMIMNLYRNIDRSRIQFDFVENSFERADYDDEIESLGGIIYRCPHFSFNNMLAYTKWWDNFFAEHAKEYKIIHGHIGSTASIYLRKAKKYNLITIAHSHNTKSTLGVKEILYRLMSYPTRYIADYFFACSNAAGVDRYGKKVAEDKKHYFIFRNAIDTNSFKYCPETRNKIREEYGIQDDTYLIGHVGRFMEQKNHKFLVEIFNELLKIHPEAVLMLVGDGSLRPQIELQIEQLGIADHVIFTGVRKNVNEFMMAMDLLLFPSKYEGLPVTMVEAQTSGLPSVISDYVPDECILVPELVTVQKLADSAKKWADHSLIRLKESRIDCQQIVVEKGFDISETTKWLEDFYESR